MFRGINQSNNISVISSLKTLSFMCLNKTKCHNNIVNLIFQNKIISFTLNIPKLCSFIAYTIRRILLKLSS